MYTTFMALSSPLYNFFQILPEPGILVVDSIPKGRLFGDLSLKKSPKTSLKICLNGRRRRQMPAAIAISFKNIFWAFPSRSNQVSTWLRRTTTSSIDRPEHSAISSSDSLPLAISRLAVSLTPSR